jgi:hypothetical protein
MARRAISHRSHKALHRAARHRPSTLAKVGALLAAPIPDVELLIGAMANPASGIKFVLGIARKAGKRISEVQSVIFDKLKWTSDAAKQWLQEHGFTGSGKDEGATFWRFRQQSLGKYKEFRTIVPGTKPNPDGQGSRFAILDGVRVGLGTNNRVVFSTDWEYLWKLAAKGDRRLIKESGGPSTYGHTDLFYIGKDVRSYPAGEENPTPGESIESYQEHLETTTDPEFRSATPGEQAAAMTAQDLCENPAGRYRVVLRTPDGSEHWAREYPSHATASKEASRIAFSKERHQEGATLSIEQYGVVVQEWVSSAGVWREVQENPRQNPSPVVLEIQRQLIAQGLNPRLGYVAMDPNTLKVSMGTNGVIIHYDSGRDLYDVTEYHGFDKLLTQTGLYVEALAPQVHAALAPREGYGELRQNPSRTERWNVYRIEPDGTEYFQSYMSTPPNTFWGASELAAAIRQSGGNADFKETERGLRVNIHTRERGREGLDEGYKLIRVAEDLLRESEKKRAAFSTMRRNPSGDLGQQAFNAAKDFRLSGAYSETGVANARVAKYGFTKWYNGLGPAEAKGKRKSTLLKNWMEGWAAGKRVEKKGNPESDAAQLYEDFHGKPPSETLEIVTDKQEHEWLTQLGLLVELKVATLTNLDATLSFEKDAPNLCSSENGRQLYIEGGDQALDLKALKMDGDKWLKDSMMIGVAYELTYQTEKGFQNFKLTDYYHKLGEETGVQPFLLYDPRNQLLSISGGQYQTKPEGIVN